MRYVSGSSNRPDQGRTKGENVRGTSKDVLRLSIGVALLAVLIAVAAVAAFAHSSTAAVRSHTMTPASREGAKGMAIGNPLANATGSVHFSCQLTSPAGCYGPDQIRAAYSVQPLLDQGYDGTGRTIGIVDAYGSPTLESDLDTFDTLWGLPAMDVDVQQPFGVDATTPGNATGWQQETSLDVQWAHAIAPGAKIVLVVAKSNDDKDILDATEWLGNNTSADVLSQSYGEAEQCMDPTQLARQHKVFDALSAKGITIFASSGDQGAGIPACSGDTYYIKAASTPASDPDVTGVGGTDLHADGTSGAYQSESTWNESELLSDAVAGGGGVSILFKRPDFQAPFVKDSHAREVPDVSYNAAIFNGVIARAGGSYFRFGGTSAGSPQWAALAAITDQIAGGRVGAINKTLYKLAKMPKASSYFHDIADGSNNTVPNFTADGSAEVADIAGFDAVPGYDMATGLGSPIASALLPAIAKPGKG
jgi:subtilase family serine protease